MVVNLFRQAPAVMVTCEHAGHQVPREYRCLFSNRRRVLESHRGYDAGALDLATKFSDHFSAPLLSSNVTRLLVDLNRSIGHRNLHAEWIQPLAAEIRQEIIENYYLPYRSEAERLVMQGIEHRRVVVHISCHSFTNSLNGTLRKLDIGLLYDPSREQEQALCRRWQSLLKGSEPYPYVRRNYPYKGSGDGLTSALRKTSPRDGYLGVEVEVNQNLLRYPERWATLQRALINSFDTVLGEG